MPLHMHGQKYLHMCSKNVLVGTSTRSSISEIEAFRLQGFSYYCLVCSPPSRKSETSMSFGSDPGFRSSRRQLLRVL
jgi:hypothetical protein